MKHKLLSLLALMLLAVFNFTSSFAQDELWGITAGFGPKAGSVFSLKSDGTAFTTRKTFDNEAKTINGKLTLGVDGKLYGVSYEGGNPGNGGGDFPSYGTAFRVNVDGSNFTILHYFNKSTDGSHPYGGIISGGDGYFYGRTRDGGSNDAGTLFKIKADGSEFKVLKNFTDPFFEFLIPQDGLTLGADGKIYGANMGGGTNHNGTIFRINRDGSDFTVLRHLFADTDGAFPSGGLTLGSDGKFYGIARIGGTSGVGTIFRINPDGSGFTVLKHMDGDEGEVFPDGGLIMGPDGKLYGMTQGGDNNGTIFRINSDGSGFTILRNLDKYSDGANPQGELTFGADGKLYGTTSEGGLSDKGTLFRINTDGSSFTILKQFGLQLDGGAPQGGLTRSTDGKLYGTTGELGLMNAGTIFQLNSDGNGFVVLKHLGTPANGSYPVDGLTQGSDGKFYGMGKGGNYGEGIIFRMNADGNGYTVLKHLSATTDGASPQGHLTQGADGKFYGANGYGGNKGGGTLFRINSDGSNYTVLWHFNADTDGSTPVGSLVQGPTGDFYGMANGGGANNGGTLFRIQPNGSGFTVIKHLNSSEASPSGGFTLGADGKLYGVTYYGGNNASDGTIFRVNPDGSEFTILKKFNRNTDGYQPYGGLIQGADGKFYGTTSLDASQAFSRGGTIFRINSDGSGFTVLHRLYPSTEGYYSFSPLTQGTDGTLYGVTSSGGAHDVGTIFRVQPDGSGFTILRHLNSSADGAKPMGRLIINKAISSPISISSISPMSAPVGAGVAIRGTDFTAGSTVRFNGVAATQVSFESPTLLIATVPAGASSGSIQVSNANGTATSAGSLSVAAVTSLWQAKSALPAARTQHGAVAISSNGRVYAFGGTNGAELSSLEIYNTNAFAWTTGAPIPTATRGAAFVRGTDNQIYLFSGYGGGSNRSQSYKYNPATNTWTALASLFTPVWAASAAASGHLIYVFGGQTAAGTASNQVQIYNTQTNAWTSGAAMPTALMQHQAVTSYNGKIYLFGGRTAAQGGLSDGVLVYNPTTNSWSTGASMPVPKAQFGTVLNNDGRIFLVGGRGSYVPNQGPFFHTVEIYDPKTNTWSEGPALPSPLGGQTLVNSYGNLFMMGGIDGAYRNYNWRLVLPPVAPTSAKATAVSASQIKVEWVDAAGNENRYEVERATSASGPWTVIATTAANAITHTDGNRAANTTYFYRVRGGNSSGYGAYSAIVSATTWATGANARESVEEEATSLNLQAAPNPFSHTTTITFTAGESGKAVLDLYDLQGRKLQQVFNGEVQAGETQKAEVNGSRLGQGIYLLRLANGSQVQHLKVLIRK